MPRLGATVKTRDLLVAAYAVQHDVHVLTLDAAFEQMRKKGVPLRLS